MQQQLIQKTHYEMTLDLINNHGLFLDTDFDTFVKLTEAACGKSPTYPEFALSPSLQELGHLGDENPKYTAQLAVAANVLFHIYSLYQNHERIYYVCPKLAIDLARTEVNVDTYFLKAPFPEIYIQVDPGLFYLTDTVDNGVKPVRGLYINFEEKFDIKYIRIMAVALQNTYSNLNSTNDDAIFYFRIELTPGKVKDSIKKYLDKSLEHKKEELRKYGGITNIDHLEELFFFVFNVLLYITSKDPDIINQLPMDFRKASGNLKNKGKIKKMQQRESKATKIPILIVGSQTLSSHTLDQVKNSGGIGKWKLDKKLYVSGHWKMQWKGSEKDATRRAELIYVKPYEKGPEMADVLSRKYQVGTV